MVALPGGGPHCVRGGYLIVRTGKARPLFPLLLSILANIGLCESGI
jgi:hypothetical protein